MTRVNKQRLDHLVASCGTVESRSQAQRLIMAGLVYVNGQKADKPGALFTADAHIEIREPLPYVSRGGLKLAHALQTFPFDSANKVCLDVGASTGGFTDVLLQHHARKVYAVDVGHGQLHYRLRRDPRVVNLEKTHVRLLDRHLIPEDVDALVIDTSFISLTRVLPHAWPLLKAGGWCVALIKPQFEVGAKHLRKGVVRSAELRQAAIDKVLDFVRADLPDAKVIGVVESPIKGPKGNIEFLLGLSKREGIA
ncbi:MAG: TlyA family RNA methyltransferase [Zetaproteobacteria bacterium]|nr:MAG: TlyA family RNA methyltransferase [Zetaproteobacteria bacterium]